MKEVNIMDYLTSNEVLGYSDETNINEHWKFAPQHDNYLVSDHGRVWTRNCHRFLKGGICGRQGCAYPTVGLYKAGVGTYYLVSRLVAMLFLPNPNNYPEVKHIDGNHFNNVVTNLKWGKIDPPTEQAKEASYKMLRQSIVAVELSTKKKTIFPSQCEAARVLGISQGQIANVLRNHQNRTITCGYTFERCK
jgi:hypothetical protein